MARRIEKGFIWITPDRKYDWTVNINGVDIRDYILSAKFTRSLVGEEMGCDIELDNSGEQYTSMFDYGDTIVFKMDNGSATTIQWEGKLEEQKAKLNMDGFTLQIRGSHYTASLLDITVTEEFTNAGISTILTNLISDYLTGFTSTNVAANNTQINIKFNNKPLFDCIVDLMNISGYDCYIDNDKDFHFFQKESINNEEEAIVWDDSLIEIQGLGADNVDVKNKLIVYGDAGGLPIIHTEEDTNSQTNHGTKEKVIEDSGIKTNSSASSFASSEIDILKSPEVKGTATCTFMHPLRPGDLIPVIYPPMNVHDFYRIIKYTYSVPEERLDFTFSKETSISKLLKARINKDVSQENLKNKNKMKYSYNFTFDDNTGISSTETSSNIVISDGKIGISSGTTGTIITNAKSGETYTPSQCELQVIGEGLNNILFYIAFDNNSIWQQVSTFTQTSVLNTGIKPKIKVVINSTSSFIDSIALLYK